MQLIYRGSKYEPQALSLGESSKYTAPSKLMYRGTTHWTKPYDDPMTVTESSSYVLVFRGVTYQVNREVLRVPTQERLIPCQQYLKDFAELT
ncbi:MAG: hypothetical protein DCF20_03850 [Pseudanabaena sp.]|nr:MAG: hypothetical protein DCF20_03850 [Pseudanabaena sp.]